MDDLETRKARRIEQMVAKWLRRSRDNSARGKASVGDRSSDVVTQPITRIKLTVDIQKDALFGNYGFEVSQNPPLLITAVAAGSAADGKLLPGDHIIAINNEVVEDVTGEQAAVLLRDLEESTQFTILRCISGGPKSSFLTAEKRARLKTNPVKVRFAEEVVVNGHSQGSSLLCMPNVLKVYLENGQTKAFKFETNTTVKDIILTLKEKLSIRSIDHFALVLEEQYNVLKMYLLHEDELIQQIAQRKESHDYRCLFRVCFIPKDPLDLLQQDSVAFEYLYLQSCSDVLQERFAVEMKCSVALRLAALHIQERIITCAQPQRVSLKYIEKDWGIENFISPTLLRNMRGKDIKKAISFHMKRNQLLLDPRPKHLLSAAQVRLCYLQILGDLKLYGGKIFNATLMLQDRDSCVALLVGAKYGISQVVNNKLNIVTMLAEFANISRVELTEESDKVSMVKIYLQDVKLLTLLLESNSAKDLACLVAGYYRLLVDSSRSIFVWEEGKPQTHRFSTEEGYESRTGSDSEESSGRDSSLDRLSDVPKCINPLFGERREQEEEDKGRKTPQDGERNFCNGYDNTNDSLSDASDSANTESRGFKTSGSSDSLDALEEDDLEACSSSRPEFFHLHTPTLQELTRNNKGLLGVDREDGSKAAPECFFSFLPSSHMPIPLLPQLDAEFRKESEINVATLESKLAENNVMEYYSLCANISPASSGEKNTHSGSSECSSLKDLTIEPNGDDRGVYKGKTHGFILAPPPGFGDTSSDDEFYDAAERITPTEAQGGPGKLSLQSPQNCTFPKVHSCCNTSGTILARQSRRMHGPEKEPTCDKSLRKRRSFLQTNYTSQVTFPLAPSDSLEDANQKCDDREPGFSETSYSPSVVSLTDGKRETNFLEAHDLVQLDTHNVVKKTTSPLNFMDVEPIALETKAVTDSVVSISAVCLQSTQEGAECSHYTLHSLPAEKHDSSFISVCVSDQSTVNISEISSQMENMNKICNEKAEDLAETSCGVEEHCIVSPRHPTKEILENTMGVTKDSPEVGVSYVLIEEVIHTTTKPPHSLDRLQDKQFSCAPTFHKYPLPVEKHEQHVLGSCDSILHKSGQAHGDLLLQGNTNEGPMTDLLPHCDEASGIPSHPSCLSFNSMVDQAEICRETNQRNVPINRFNLKENLLPSEILSQEPHHLSSLTISPKSPFSTDLAGDHNSKTKDFTRDAPHVDYKREQHSTLIVLSEVNMEPKKPDNSAEPNYFSLAAFCRSVEPSEENSVSNQTFLCSSNSTEDATASVSYNSMGSPDPKKTLSPKYKMDKCSCQLTYASCFCGPDNEVELKDTRTDSGGTSEKPLTTPPLTRSPQFPHFNPTRFIQGCNQINAGPQNGENHMRPPESHIEALSYLKNRMSASPLDFCHLLDNVVKLQEILRQFVGNRMKHTRDRCSVNFSENKNILCMESQRLMSSCQKVTKTYGPSMEIQSAIQDTFQNLLQLTEVCFQFTNCGLCSKKHKDLAVNLKDLVSSYHQFVQAAKQACDRGYPTLNVKLLVCQYTALTAALFCLVQQFRMPTCA